MLKFTMKVTGAKETQAHLDKVATGLPGALNEAMRRSTLAVTRSAKTYAPVDTGNLRASITPSVTTSSRGVTGVVGSPVKYAPSQEEGTRAFWPPLYALETWARRHGATAYAVARAISRRGIRAKHYLKRALDDNIDRIVNYFVEAIRGLVQ